MIFKMSKSREIYDALEKDFPHAMQEITQLSKNDQGKCDFIISSEKAFNYDTLWNPGGSTPNKEKSPDALFLYNEIMYFIEFKEGNSKRDDVRQKIYEGINSLYQYASKKGIVTKEEFFDIVFRYALVRRFEAKRDNSFVLELEKSQDIFSLKNIEGYFVTKTAVRWVPKSIFELLHKVSNGSIKSIEYVSPCQKIRTKIQ